MASVNSELTKLKLNAVIPHIAANAQLQINNANVNGHCAVLWLIGRPGIGKSDIFEQCAKKYKWGLIAQYMSTCLLEQLSGLPLAAESHGNVIPWSIPEIMRMGGSNDPCWRVQPPDLDEKGNTNSPVILLLDDAHLCDKTMQRYLFQLLTYRSIHSHKLPKNVVLMFAGNRPGDKAGFQQILAPVVNRIRFLEVDADAEDWIMNFAIPNRLRADIISYLTVDSHSLCSEPLESRPWASPRSWTYLSQDLDMWESLGHGMDINNVLAICIGLVGTEMATSFNNYRTQLMKWEAQSILDGKKRVNIANLTEMERFNLLFALSMECIKNLRKGAFKVNKAIEGQFKIFAAILSEMVQISVRVVPTALKMIMAESVSNGSTDLIDYLVTDKEISLKINKVLES